MKLAKTKDKGCARGPCGAQHEPPRALLCLRSGPCGRKRRHGKAGWRRCTPTAGANGDSSAAGCASPSGVPGGSDVFLGRGTARRILHPSAPRHGQCCQRVAPRVRGCCSRGWPATERRFLGRATRRSRPATRGSSRKRNGRCHTGVRVTRRAVAATAPRARARAPVGRVGAPGALCARRLSGGKRGPWSQGTEGVYPSRGGRDCPPAPPRFLLLPCWPCLHGRALFTYLVDKDGTGPDGLTEMDG